MSGVTNAQCGHPVLVVGSPTDSGPMRERCAQCGQDVDVVIINRGGQRGAYATLNGMFRTDVTVSHTFVIEKPPDIDTAYGVGAPSCKKTGKWSPPPGAQQGKPRRW